MSQIVGILLTTCDEHSSGFVFEDWALRISDTQASYQLLRRREIILVRSEEKVPYCATGRKRLGDEGAVISLTATCDSIHYWKHEDSSTHT
jgi:hypothetical protein